jgi:glycosyltransferase involved in cell wall biosynthesis
MKPKSASIVIPTRNEGRFLGYTVAWILANSGETLREIIVIDDGSTDGSVLALAEARPGDERVRILEGERQGPARARNLGGRAASGEYVIFIDAHCHVPPSWIEGMVGPLAEDSTIALVGCSFADFRTPGVGFGAGCTWGGPSLDLVWLPRYADRPYPVPLLPGGCQALRRCDFVDFAEYDGGMCHIGSEGEEQSLRCWLMGRRVFVEPRVVVHHQFRDGPPYEVRAGKLILNRLRVAAMHFSPERIERVVAALKHQPYFDSLLLPLLDGDVLEQRRAWHQRRRQSDDWFFETFGIPA